VFYGYAFKGEQCYKIVQRGKSLNKKGLAWGLLLLLISTSVMPLSAQDIKPPSQPTSNGGWLYVGGSGPGNYTTIQDAIDNASDGDTVFVFNGTYVGYVVINKSITLLGEEKNTTIIIGYFAFTISFITDWVTMGGFTIVNNACRGEGVRIDSSNNTFFNNIIDIPNDRIRLFGHNNTVSGNTIRNTYLYVSGDDNIISGNSFTNTYYHPLSNDYYGIYLVDCWDNIISNNSFFNSGVFISLENICNNIVTNNTVNDKPLLYVYNQSNLVLDMDAGQIILVNCTNITIQNQEIFNTTVGIQIATSNSCVLSSNTITGNQYGICLNGGNNTIDDNRITNNSYGIDLSGDNNIISDNILSNNRGCIYFHYSTDYNTIIENTITDNNNSILLDYGSDFNNFFNNTITNNIDAIRISGDSNTLVGNTITNTNDNGIFVIYSDYINIIDNTITNNNGVGIFLTYSNNNNIIKNAITNNFYDGINLCGENTTISGNTITNNTYDGIYLYGDHNTLSANTITYSNNGIYVLKHEFNTIAGNTITWNNGSGIYLNCSSNNSISGNSIIKNRLGIYLFLSNNNTVLKNNFLRNKRYALFENCTNSWNQNYWGRPRILPKLIFGTRILQNKWVLPPFDIDWHPALRPYDIGE
jgi:parallel beta-helix repeat protein